MARDRIGGLPPRYAFALNPFVDMRVSKCPLCNRPTHLRKFALLIHIDQFGSLVIGKTCRYCTPCELIVAHQNELEAELAHGLERIAPEVVGNEYFVIGTVDKKVWQRGLRGDETRLNAMLPHVAEFQKRLDLKIEGGWTRA